MCDKCKEQFEDVIAKKKAIIREHPLEAVGIAAGIGAGIGLLAGILISKIKLGGK